MSSLNFDEELAKAAETLAQIMVGNVKGRERVCGEEIYHDEYGWVAPTIGYYVWNGSTVGIGNGNDIRVYVHFLNETQQLRVVCNDSNPLGDDRDNSRVIHTCDSTKLAEAIRVAHAFMCDNNFSLAGLMQSSLNRPICSWGPHTEADRIDHCGSCGAESESHDADKCPACGAPGCTISTWGEFQHERFRNGDRYSNNGPQYWEDGPQPVNNNADEAETALSAA